MSDAFIRSLERDFQQTPTQETQLPVNIARMRAGLLPLPRIYHYIEGWTAQTILQEKRIISSATVSHDGWWGIGHATWSSGDSGDSRMVDLGDHFVREYHDRSRERASENRPTKEEVALAHQQVVQYLLEHLQTALSRRKYYRWAWPS
jgi:hypothetical protein